MFSLTVGLSPRSWLFKLGINFDSLAILPGLAHDHCSVCPGCHTTDMMIRFLLPYMINSFTPEPVGLATPDTRIFAVRNGHSLLHVYIITYTVKNSILCRKCHVVHLPIPGNHTRANFLLINSLQKSSPSTIGIATIRSQSSTSSRSALIVIRLPSNLSFV